MPLTWLFVASTKSHGDLVGTGGFTFADFDLFTNLGDLFSYGDGVYGRWLLNSVLYFGLGLPGLHLRQHSRRLRLRQVRIPAQEKLFGLVLLGVLVPSAVLVLLQYLLAGKAAPTTPTGPSWFPLLVNPFGVYLARVFSEGTFPTR